MVPKPHYVREVGITNAIKILHLLKDEYFIHESENQAYVSKGKMLLIESNVQQFKRHRLTRLVLRTPIGAHAELCRLCGRRRSAPLVTRTLAVKY